MQHHSRLLPPCGGRWCIQQPLLHPPGKQPPLPPPPIPLCPHAFSKHRETSRESEWGSLLPSPEAKRSGNWVFEQLTTLTGAEAEEAEEEGEEERSSQQAVSSDLLG